MKFSLSSQDKFELCKSYCDYAATKLKSSGFKHVYTSLKSEACYYSHPMKPEYNVRIAMHKFGRSEGVNIPKNHGRTVANIIFPVKNCSSIPHTWEKVDTFIFLAVGRYFCFTGATINRKGYGL